MYGDQYFFELPIYIESEDSYLNKVDELIEEKARKAWKETSDPRKDLEWYRERKNKQRDRYLHEFGGAWRYNQIFGFLCIYPLGCQIRGATWYTTKKLVRRNIWRRDIDYCSQAFDLTIDPSQTSDEIFSLLIKRIRKLEKERPYIRRHIDTRPLELVGPFLDCVALWTFQHDLKS